MAQIFLMEFHIGSINFDPNFTPTPKKKQITVNIQFSSIIKTDISPIQTAGEEETETGETIEFNVGKTLIFFHKPKTLLGEFKLNPLEFTLRVDKKVEGSAKFIWREEFSDTVKILDKIRMVKAVDYNSSSMELKNSSGKIIATFDLFLRMNCYGDSVQTQFQARKVNQINEYIFRNPETSNTFKCEKMSDSAIIPVVALFVPATRESDVPDGGPHQLWEEIAGPDMLEVPFNGDPKTLPSEGIALSNLYGQGSADTVSMYFRPSEHKFYDLLNLMTAEVSTNDNGTSVVFTRDRPVQQKKVDSGGVLVDYGDELQLTADKIGRTLCRNKDCPAARKFKEFGIGPLATGKGLGTLYKDVDPPVEYGMSQTYGTMSNYGPFGVFAMPKRPEESPAPSVSSVDGTTPPQHNPEESERTKNSKQCPYMLRLRGGGPVSMDEAEGPKSPIMECKSVMDQMDEILRAYKKALGPCGEATCPFSQNSAEESCKKLCENAKSAPSTADSGSCRSVPCNIMDCPYNEPATNKYPAGCGSPKCAYTKYKLGLVDDDAALELQFLPPAVSGKCGHPKCKYLLQPDLPPIHWDCPEPLPKGNCKNPNCPLLPPDLKKLKIPKPKRGPCGSANCPYAIPSPCDSPTCPFRAMQCPLKDQNQEKTSGNKSCCQPQPEAEDQDDCGDPECCEPIKGEFTACGNPECPFAAQMTPKSDNTCGKQECPLAPKPKSTCDNPECPFSETPEESNPCGNPNCPFASKPKEENPCGNPDCPFASKPKEEKPCGNPDCPFAPKPKETHSCGNPSCPFTSKPKETHSCGNPACPFESKPKHGSGYGDGDPNCPFVLKQKEANSCGDPNCPFASKSKNADICDNPKCPFASKPKESNLCGNPDCPAASRGKSKNSCGEPNCPFASKPKETNVCDNPDCPFAAKQKDPNLCDNPDCPAASRGKSKNSCGDPNCPFASKPKETNVCDNPDCPFAAKQNDSNLCDNPECPAASRGKSKNSCDNPDCPFASKAKGSSICDNPDCPFASKAKGSSICDNPDCPFASKTKSSSICDNPDCPFASKVKSSSICDNPDCPFASKSKDSSLCDNPDCPYASKPKDSKICDNPDCPFAEKKQQDICDNPDCPFAKKPICDDPFCPYLQPLPSCGVPNCPYEPTPLIYCPAKIAEYKKRQNDAVRQAQREEEKVQRNYEYDECSNDGKKNPPKKRKSSAKANSETKPDGERRNSDAGKTGDKGDGGEKADQTGVVKGNGSEKFAKGKVGAKGAGGVKSGDGGGGGKPPGGGGKKRHGKIGKVGKRKKRGKFVYSMGDKYPGVKVGHKECVMPFFHVPAKMGWLWNVYQPRLWLKPRKGWRPGAIQRTIAARIRAHRQSKGLGTPNVPSFRKKRKGEAGDTDSEMKIAPKPTLQIQKKEGAYWITMNPLKDPYTLEENENPYMDCTPMQFKITKNKNRKKAEDDENDESRLCYCETDMESSSSDSELDIEFTPPAGIIHPERFKKKHNVIHCDTQYDPKDFAVKKQAKEAKGKGKGKGGKGKDKGKDKEKAAGKKGKK